MIKQGKLKWYNHVKGYGFITRDEGQADLFVHISEFRKSGIKIKYLNIGGGFPGKYSEKNLPTLTEYFEKINSEFKKNFNYYHDVKLLSEPGRVLVYDCMSLVVKVILKKKKKIVY